MNTIEIQHLLSAWEATYKKGQLTFWIFLSLKESKKYVDEIKVFVEQKSNYTMNCEEQSLYRNLRKYKLLNIVDFEYRKGNKGPDRKYYFLTVTGQVLLQQFIKRNIHVFMNPEINNLLKQ